MILPGLVSITFRQLTATEVIAVTRKADLCGIEWGGDVHVPQGDVNTATKVLLETEAAGLRVAAYGSYYRLGHSEENGLSWNSVLQTARALEAPSIRVWAGVVGSASASPKDRKRVIEDARRVCDSAAEHEIDIALEYHGGSLTDRIDSTIRLLQSVDRPNLKTLWQPQVNASEAACVRELKVLLPWLSNLHVFQWNVRERRPLVEGKQRWQKYFDAVGRDADRWALLEFVKDAEPQQLFEDAKILNAIL